MNQNIEAIKEEYRRLAAEAELGVEAVRCRIGQVSAARLLLFVAAGAGVYAVRSMGGVVVTLTLLAAVALFLLLVKQHNRLFRRREELETEARMAREELGGLELDYSPFDGADELRDAAHLYGFDLDLFGRRSLFQAVNRTCTAPGRRRLAAWLAAHLTAPQEIRERQAAVAELARQAGFCRRFRLLGLLQKGAAADEEELRLWAEAPSQFGRSRWARWWPAAVVSTNMVCLAAVLAGWLTATAWGTVWAVLVVLSFRFTQRINKWQAAYGRKLQVLSTYAELLQLMDGQTAEAKLLRDIRELTGGEERRASQAIRRLGRLMHELDQRNNLFMYALLNGSFGWEVRQVLRIEAWKEQHAAHLPRWMEAIGRMDALCSLATFAYNHPDYVFPTLLTKEESEAAHGSSFCFRAEGLGHPLMARERCVRNDIDMRRRPAFFIITGANMAGKSTYLRTVGVNFLLACTGAPVCATGMELTPVRLVTSLRTSDSLADNESYFFAELKRLKLIIDMLQRGEELFIVLDEILKGTNSVDKQRGSMALVRQLMALRANGIIATHDLLLGTLIETFPPHSIRNFCFEADIRNDELTFDYRLRTGVARNMNACFLMQKMGIDFSETTLQEKS